MSIEKTPDGGFILTGTKGKDLLLAKIQLDRSGRAELLTSASVEQLTSRKDPPGNEIESTDPNLEPR